MQYMQSLKLCVYIFSSQISGAPFISYVCKGNIFSCLMKYTLVLND